MGIFNTIKKSRRESSDIDEKIEYLNKELEKTGLREGMTTANIYTSGSQIDNPIYNSFTSSVFNAKPLGFSPSDNTQGLGGAYTGKMVPSEVGLTPGYHDSILNTKGAALSPPHPVSGKRRYASTRLGGMIGQQYFPTRPGVIQGNRSLPTGSVAWLWNPNINNTDDTTGNWYPLEFEPHSGQWGFWDTNFMGFGYLNTNLSQLEFTSGDNVGATVLSLFNTIGIRQKGVIGTPQTIVLQKNDLGDVGFLPIDVGLSKQGYDYLSGKARKGARSLRGGTVYRKAGGSGGRRTTTTRGAKLIPYGRGGKVSSRGVGNYIRSKGAGFSPSANRVAQNVAKELPPKPTPAEIRNETVKQFRENGDNYAANKFYTEDRISELESKPELTSTEQKELDQLKVNAVHLNQNPPPPKPEQIETNIESINTSLANGDIGAFANAVATASIPSTIETAFDTNNETHRALSEMSPDQLEKALESLEFKTPNPVSVMWKSLIQHYAEGGGVLDAETRTGFGNKLAIAKAVLTGEDVNVTSGDIADSEKENYVSSLRPEDFGTNIQINNGVAGYVDDNIIENPDGTTRPNTEGAESVTNDFNYGSSIGNFGQNHTQFVVPDGVTLEMLKNGEGWDKTRVSTRDYAYANTDKLKDPAARAEEFGPYAKFFEAAQFLGNLNPFNKGTEGKPDNVSAAAKTTFEQSGDTLSDEQKAAIIASMEKNGVNNIENPLDDKVANPPSRVEKQQDKDYEKNRRRNRYSNPKENNADKYPPPKQESIFTDEDGNKTKFYTRKIFTGKDGKTYKEVLRMPWIQPKGGGNGYFAGLHSPSSYIFSFSLFDTPMDEPLGDYTPPDDLPDIPYTPEPEPKPKPQGGYGGGQGNPTNRRGSGARSEDTLYQSKGKLLSEAAKLGHFEPEILNVDINDLRKGIMPEFPKDPPPKMVDGYSEKSKLAPKTIEGEPFIKITKKDLAKNHMLKDSEIKKFMDEIDSINKYIKENPSELIYAQQRYPKDDPRLAQLNWEMDQMLGAGKEYMDKHFPENKKLFKKVQKAISKNIELTDPKSFKGVKVPKYKGVDLTDYKRRKAVVSKHFKKAVKIRKLFSKNRWLQTESFTNITTGNKVGQTFRHNPSGQTVSTAGALGGVESVPSTVSVFGDNIPGPNASSYALQGYAKPLGNVLKRKETEDTNSKLSASQEFAKEIGVDQNMDARVSDEFRKERVKRRGTAKISDKQKRINKAAETFIRYLTNQLPEGKWNDYMGKDYVKYAFEYGYLNDMGGITVGDNVIGSASSLTFDEKSGKYRMNFKGLGVDDNFTQFSKGDYSLWRRAALNALGKYSADLQPSGLPWWLGSVQTAIGAGASKVLEFAKAFGGGKDVDAFIEIDPDELQQLNPHMVQDLLRQKFGLTGEVWSPRMMGSPKGSNPKVTHNYYALYGKLPPRSVKKGSVPMNLGDHPEYDPAVIAKLKSMRGSSSKDVSTPTDRTGFGYDTKGKLDSSGYGMDPNRDTETEARPYKPLKSPKNVKSVTKTRRQSLSLDEPLVRRKKKKT